MGPQILRRQQCRHRPQYHHHRRRHRRHRQPLESGRLPMQDRRRRGREANRAAAGLRLKAATVPRWRPCGGCICTGTWCLREGLCPGGSGSSSRVFHGASWGCCDPLVAMNTGVACKSLFKYGIHGWLQTNPAARMYWLGQLGGHYTCRPSLHRCGIIVAVRPQL